MYPKIELPSTKTLISTAASAAATAVVLRSFARDFIPKELRQYFFTKCHYLLTAFSNEITLIIDEFEGLNKNQLFYAAELYLSTIANPSVKSFRASLPEKEKKIQVSMGGNEEIEDKFIDFQLKWRMIVQRTQSRMVPFPDEFNSSMKTEVRYLQLTFHKKFKSKVIDEYLPYILERSKAVKEEKKTLKLHTLKGDRMHGIRSSPWQSVNLDHPANFETLAMDDEIKNMIIDDLDMFLKRKEFYRKVGKAWKRGYLLYGPPGTGKSSLIAAIANYLNFDVYDLELTDLRCNSDLRRLLIATANRSILVVEDIDASIDLSERKKAEARPPKGMYPYQYNQGSQASFSVTLSGLLNFIDGLWSSCGDERIIIFTTNHIEKLDQALLRPGRMDVHIHMSYCTPCGFKMLLTNYLGFTEHPLVLEAEALIATTKVTPAEIGEHLLKSDDPRLALRGLIKFLEHKKENGKVGEENLEVPKRVVVQKEDGLKEIIKWFTSVEMKEKMVKKDEVANALKILVKFLEGETGNDVKESDTSLASSVAILSESGKEDGDKTE
ncbi:hypothetical protein BUALT_Bualt15G0021900 [Buddleja alternifolia]|uniref:AAA+ ATPase domain-containing protein n=1 Tax=Buddleja alternifolia TaxID=168488 RepID=A0AAV6WDP1_9LAMI|nr:hypothetical protein BUALT_Bualt15G0021900 [Buddleja alternifolia]